MHKSKKIKVPRFNIKEGFYTSQSCSEQMSRIRSENTKCEIQFRKALWNLGYRYRKNIKSLPGKPDVVLRKFKIVVFIDGDFWHGSMWKTRKPKLRTNSKYWIPKIERNIQRDLEVNEQLNLMGWTIIRFWESDILKNLDKCVSKTIEEISRKAKVNN